MSSYFVAGTGTDVGKTFTTCALIGAARRKRWLVSAYKPVITGYVEGDVASDSARIAAALGEDSIAAISPWRFALPIAPNLAAQDEGRVLGLGELTDWTRSAVTQNGLTLIETVGGAMVPLNAQVTTRDWMVEIGLPILLVTGTYLGCMSHTLCTFEALRGAGLLVKAVIINASPMGGELAAIADTLRQHLPPVPLVAQPRVASPDQATATHALLEQLA